MAHVNVQPTETNRMIHDTIDLKVFKAEELANAAAAYLYEKITATISRKGNCNIAISGGSTPWVAFGLLAKTHIDWDKLHLFFVDERTVPVDSPDSSYGTLMKNSLSEVIPATNIHRYKGEINPAQAAADYSDEIKAHFGTDEPVFDIIHLGMGDDGHTASLFPDTAGLDQGGIAIANHVPKLDTWRLTLTRDTINRADHVVFILGGAGKAQVLKDVLYGPYVPSTLPIQLIQPMSTPVFLADEAATGLIV